MADLSSIQSSIQRRTSTGTSEMIENMSRMRRSSLPDADVSKISPDTKWNISPRTREDVEEFARMFKAMTSDKSNIFGHGLAAGDVKILAALSQTVELRPGDVFCTETEAAQHLAVIVQGMVSVITLRRIFASLGPGRLIGEIGLVKGFHVRSATVRAETAVKLAVMPYDKFLRFLKNLGEEKESLLISFCVNELVPRYRALDFFKLKHRSATLIQSNYRSRLAQHLLRRFRQFWLMKSALRIQRLFRRHHAKMMEKRAYQIPSVRTIEAAWRSRIARRELRRVRRLRRQGYLAVHEKAATTIQRTFRVKWLKLESRKKGNLERMGSVLVDMDEEEKARTTDNMMKLRAKAETSGLFQKWKRIALVRCFNTWKAFVSALCRQVIKARLAARSLVYGALYSSLHLWKKHCDNVTVVSPWRGRKGKLVELSAEGKEFEYARGKRLEGDSGCGELVQRVVADGTMWQVRWQSSGLCGSYFTGSCGRYHLLWWQDQREEQKVVDKKVNWITSFHKALGSVRTALQRDKGIHMQGHVTPAFGGRLQLPCPLGSTWMITAEFPPRAVLQTCAVKLSAIEAAEFDAVRSEKGHIVSPMVSVMPLDGVFVIDNPFSLSFPHRCAATSSLAVYFFHEGRGGSDRVQAATFTDNSCTVTVERFGLYAVVNSAVSVPDVVYGALELPNQRDSSGRFLSRVSLGTPFKAKVVLVPRAYAKASHRVWPLLPTFQLVQGTLFEKVLVEPEQRLEGCTFNSWSARQSYTGQLIALSFHTIIQISAGHAADHSQSFPVVNLHVHLLDDSEERVVRFSGWPEFLIKIVALQVAVGIDMPDGTAHSTFVCTLHGRETMGIVRRWVAKCWFTADSTWDDLAWFCRLRFLKGRGEAQPFMALAEEVLEPATLHLQGARLVVLPEAMQGKFGSAHEVSKMMQELATSLQLPLPAQAGALSQPSRVFAQPSRSAHACKPPIIGRPSSSDYRVLLAAVARRRSVLSSKSVPEEFGRIKSTSSGDSLFAGWAEVSESKSKEALLQPQPPPAKPAPKSSNLMRLARTMDKHGPMAAGRRADAGDRRPSASSSVDSLPIPWTPPANRRQQDHRMHILSMLSPRQVRILHDKTVHEMARVADSALTAIRPTPGTRFDERKHERYRAVSKALSAALDPPRPHTQTGPGLPSTGNQLGLLRPCTAALNTTRG